MKILRQLKCFMLWSVLVLPFTLLWLPVMAQPGTNMPPLLDCGVHGNAEVICGTRSPEDFEITPDGRFLIVAKFGQGNDAPLDLYEFATGRFTTLPLSAAPMAGWGESSCTESIGEQVNPHGLSLSRRTNGQWQFFVVNHNVRESMEMYELVADGSSWKLVWHGCVSAQEPYNDVAARPDGSFVATRPQAIMQAGSDLFAGAPSGNVGQWSAAAGESVLPGSEYGYPNGVLVSADGRYAYISGWTTRNFHKYDLLNKQEVGSVDFGFMPDNLTWTADGKILAGGINGVAGNCPASGTVPCIVGSVVAEVDPATLAVRVVYDSGDQALISGTSVAIEANGSVYIGSFQGTRMLKVPR